MVNAPHQLPFTKDRIARINRRAKKLVQAAYEDFRSRMMEYPLVATGHTKPEEWLPADATEDVLELIRATATSLAATSRSLDQRVEHLAGIVEKLLNFSRTV